MILFFSPYNIKEFSFNNSVIMDDINGIFKKDYFDKILTNNVDFYKKVKDKCINIYTNKSSIFSKDYANNYEHYVPLLRTLAD